MDKKIQKLLEKATIEEELDTSGIQIADIPKEAFIKLKGKLIYHKKEDCFYRLVGEKWFRFKEEKSNIRAEIDKLYNLWQKSEELLENRLNLLEQRINEIQNHQEAFSTELKDYIDLKLKSKGKKK